MVIIGGHRQQVHIDPFINLLSGKRFLDNQFDFLPQESLLEAETGFHSVGDQIGQTSQRSSCQRLLVLVGYSADASLSSPPW
jgi:hypothetical protein